MDVCFKNDSSANNYTLAKLFGSDYTDIPSTLKTVNVLSTIIPDSAFLRCSNITTLTLSDKVTTIESNAFNRCSSLTTLTIPDSVISIAQGILYLCSGLQNLTLPFLGESENNPIVLGRLFGYSGNSSMLTISQYLSDSLIAPTLDIPKTLTKITVKKGQIAYGAFSNCSPLEQVNIEDGVTFIDFKAFYGCGNLHKLKIPFVGRSKDFLDYSNKIVAKYPFGCIFSKAADSNGAFQNSLSINQCCLLKDTGTSLYFYSPEQPYYIPADLKEVIVENNNFDVIIHDYCFENCYNCQDGV